jgi:hypothetical protein
MLFYVKIIWVNNAAGNVDKEMAKNLDKKDE